MKKSIFKSLMGIAALFMFAISVNAQPIITPVGVTARLADQLSVTKLFDVDFGGIFIPKSGNVVVTMDYLGAVSVTTGTTSLYSTNLQQEGQIQISANAASKFTIEYPTTVNLTNGVEVLVYTPMLYSRTGTTMVSSAITEYNVDTDEIGDGTFSKLINIAGTLAIPGTAKPGIYKGNVDITVTWS